MQCKTEYHNITNKGAIKLFEYTAKLCNCNKTQCEEQNGAKSGEKLLWFKKIEVLSRANPTTTTTTTATTGAAIAIVTRYIKGKIIRAPLKVLSIRILFRAFVIFPYESHYQTALMRQIRAVQVNSSLFSI